MNPAGTIRYACLLTACLLLAGCRERPPVIAAIPRTTATLLWEPMHLGIAETARSNGLEVYWNAPPDEGDTERQIGLFNTARARGYRGIILSPDETLAARSLVLETVKQGTPVVIADDELGPPPGPALSYVSNDEKAGTLLAARYIARLLKGGGTVAVMGINTRSESSLSREEDFEHALTLAAPDVHIAVRKFGDSVITHQQQIAQEILNREPPVDAIVALSAPATRGAYYAKLASSHPLHVMLIGFDQDLLLPLQTGDVNAVIVEDTRQIGRIAMSNLAREIKGEKVDGVTLIAPLLLTHDTLTAEQIANFWTLPNYTWDDVTTYQGAAGHASRSEP